MPSSPGRLLLSIACACAGFAAMAFAIRTQVPWQEEYGLATKIAWFDEHADEYDLVFLGSSRVFRGFDPQLFDAELKREGVELHSFNLGVGGVLPFEMDRMLRAVVERKPARLKWILYEGGKFDPREDVNEGESSRVVGWHSPGGVMRALASTACYELTPLERADTTLYHLKIGAWNVANYGQARAILGAWTGASLVNYRGPRISEAQLERGRGYVAIEEDPEPKVKERYELLRANPAEFFRRIEELKQENEILPRVETLNELLVREQHELARSIGAELITVVPPQRLATADQIALAKAGVLTALFDFNQPVLYPQLFTIDSRYDAGHLSRSGAIEFTRLLAARFVEHVRKGAAKR